MAGSPEIAMWLLKETPGAANAAKVVAEAMGAEAFATAMANAVRTVTPAMRQGMSGTMLVSHDMGVAFGGAGPVARAFDGTWKNADMAMSRYIMNGLGEIAQMRHGTPAVGMINPGKVSEGGSLITPNRWAPGLFWRNDEAGNVFRYTSMNAPNLSLDRGIDHIARRLTAEGTIGQVIPQSFAHHDRFLRDAFLKGVRFQNENMPVFTTIRYK